MIETETLTPRERDEITRTIAFVNAAYEALSDKPLGERARFTCPVCGGKATAAKSVCNGHIHASCSGCGCGVVQ